LFIAKADATEEAALLPSPTPIGTPLPTFIFKPKLTL
jgi:hypothetical protein